MARKLATKKGQQVYARRKAIVEPVFGQMSTCRTPNICCCAGSTKPAVNGCCWPPATTYENCTATSELTDSTALNRPNQRARPLPPGPDSAIEPRICTPRHIHRCVMWVPDTPSHQSS